MRSTLEGPISGRGNELVDCTAGYCKRPGSIRVQE